MHACPKDTELRAWAADAEANGNQMVPIHRETLRCNTPAMCALNGCSPLTWPAERAKVTIDAETLRQWAEALEGATDLGDPRMVAGHIRVELAAAKRRAAR